jgi:hypothetical protein
LEARFVKAVQEQELMAAAKATAAAAQGQGQSKPSTLTASASTSLAGGVVSVPAAGGGAPVPPPHPSTVRLDDSSALLQNLTRLKPSSKRSQEEKAWVALDALLYPDYYATHVSESEVEEMTYDVDYQVGAPFAARWGILWARGSALLSAFFSLDACRSGSGTEPKRWARSVR